MEGPLCFLHIAKTGGTSLLRALQALYPRDRIITADGHLTLELVWESVERLSARCLVYGHPLPGAASWLPANTRVITLLRKPAHHAVSAFLQVLSDDQNPDHEFAREVGLADFMRQRWTYAAFQTGTLLGALSADPIISPNQITEGADLAHRFLDRMFFVGISSELPRSIDQLSKDLNLLNPLGCHSLNTAAARGVGPEDVARLRSIYEGLRTDPVLCDLIAAEEATWRHGQVLFERRLARDAAPQRDRGISFWRRGAARASA